MGLFSPSPPQGLSSEQGLFIIGRPHIPRIDTPQGIDVSAVPPTGGSALVQTGGLSALVQTGTLEALIQTGSGL